MSGVWGRGEEVHHLKAPRAQALQNHYFHLRLLYDGTQSLQIGMLPLKLIGVSIRGNISINP